jgi:hypothetical protein
MKEQLVKNFEKNQTLTNLQHLFNAGIKLKKIENNNWIELHIFKLPVRFVPLYDKINGTFEITAIGVF